MAFRGAQPTAVLDRDGARRCARHVADRVLAIGGRCHVWLTDSTGVVVRFHSDKTRGTAHLAHFVGEFSTKSRLAEIEEALQRFVGIPPEQQREAMVDIVRALPGSSPLLGFPATHLQEAA